MSVYVAFKKPSRHSLIERAIAWFEGNGRYCHAELRFIVGRHIYFSADRWTGCHFGVCGCNRLEWDLVEVKCDESVAFKLCQAYDGDRYDYFGVLAFVLRKIGIHLKPSKGRWFCSELVSRVLSLADGPVIEKPYLVTPDELYRDLANSKCQ